MTDERSFVELLGRAARADADRVFALFDGAPRTFGTLDRRSDALALSLRGLGVAPEELETLSRIIAELVGHFH